MKNFRKIILFAFSFNFEFVQLTLSQRIEAVSIAEQLGSGAKRPRYYQYTPIYYLNTLLEKCDNVEDLNDWIIFMDSYLSCDANAQPKLTKKSITIFYKETDPVQRLSEFCTAWPEKKKCSSRLADKLDSCLGTSLEDGSAGTNALRLADAHMNFICHHKTQYIGSLESPQYKGEYLQVENRFLACFRELDGVIRECVRKMEHMRTQTTFCQKLGLASECLMSSFQMCDSENSRRFLKTMLGQLKFDLRC